VGGDARHHLIDPMTGTPAETRLAGVTVVTGTGWTAEVLAKAVFLAGQTRGAELLRANGAAGLAITDDGAVHELAEVRQFTLEPVSTNSEEGARR
jgi:thiamine biosynthesis lipoprotein